MSAKEKRSFYISVLDKGFVRLVDYMGDDTSIVQAARVSYGKGTKSKRKDADLIDYLMRNRHTSPFEMVEFKFHVKAPIFVVRQWFRHRTASVNEISGRYSILKDEFYIPQKFRKQSKTNKQGSEGYVDDDTNQKLIKIVDEMTREIYARYKFLLSKGVSRELSRIILPLNTYTEFYWKQNLHNLLHFIKLRLDSHAQEEIREYALAIAQILRELVPVTWKSFTEHILEGKNLSKTELEIIRETINKFTLEQNCKFKKLKNIRKSEFINCITK
ncbi:MAG: FAD-dependent thymidylate synthase [Candidatus Dojkabacteria bacterium]|nr:FAD-dependent thymidylate synthase [Candidatus Dojkabacteria bacterium]